MTLVSMQKTLSLVQEQVVGQRGVFGAFLDAEPPARPMHSADRQISPVHRRPSSDIVPLQDDDCPLCTQRH